MESRTNKYVCPDCGNEYLVTAFKDLDQDWRLVDIDAKGRAIWGQLEYHEFAECPLEFMGGRLIRFDDRKEVVEEGVSLLKRVNKGQLLGEALSLYRHSADTWYVSGSRWMPDEQWDVIHTAGVLLPDPEDVKYWRRLAKRKNGLSVRASMRAWAEKTLQMYSDWCNGWVYSMVLSYTAPGRCHSCGRCENLIGSGEIYEPASKDSLAYMQECLKDYKLEIE